MRSGAGVPLQMKSEFPSVIRYIFIPVKKSSGISIPAQYIANESQNNMEPPRPEMKIIPSGSTQRV